MDNFSEFQFIRMRQRNLMPTYMKEFELELAIRPRPSVGSMLKKDYISSWFGFFEKYLSSGISAVHQADLLQ